jgi:hypothetical protein
MLQLAEMCIGVQKRKKSGKEISKFFSFGNTSWNVYYRAVPSSCTVCTNIPVLKFGSYSFAIQQLNCIVTDMCARWQ